MQCPLCQSPTAAGETACNACGQPLAHGATATLSGALPSGCPLKGGDYILERVLGRGGFGITYAGRDMRLNRLIAVKEYFPQGCALRIAHDLRLEPTGGLSSAAFCSARDAFLEEARVLARFNHSSIVRIYDFFEEKNSAYMVMELLHGKTLTHLLESRRVLPEAEAIGYIEKVGAALAEIHRADLLHRDVKPDNIMVCDDGRIVLCDFGTARPFTGNTVNMDALLTPGYAPLEQYSTHGRFGAAVDIHALGATLYHLLTGVVPVPAVDRANGVVIDEPHRVQSGVSRTVSAAVMWAIEISTTRRPASINEFLLELRSTKTSPRSNTSNTRPSPAPLPSRVANPYSARIAAIRTELTSSSTPPAASTLRAVRLKEIEECLARITKLNPPSFECPSCQSARLETFLDDSAVAPDKCPLCRAALQQRLLDTSRCPVCRSGPVKTYRLPDEQLFCPACTLMPLREERRKKFGLVRDLWLTCSHCHSEWDVLAGKKAKLVSVGKRARTVACDWLQLVLPLAEWKQRAGRAGRVERCNACQAQWDVDDGTSAKLVYAPHDPHGVAAQYLGKTFFGRAWIRLAHGLPLGAGDWWCSACASDWQFDATNKTLKWLSGNEAVRASALRGHTLRLSQWTLMSAGKHSGNAGWLCRACDAEWDGNSLSAKLVRNVKGALTSHVGQIHSRSGWHRIAHGLPDEKEEKALRAELLRLQAQKNTHDAQWEEECEKRTAALQSELDDLARASWREGYIEVNRGDGSFALKPGETLRWRSIGTLLRQRTRQGYAYWDFDKRGTFVVTSSTSGGRIFLEETPYVEAWGRPLGKMRSVRLAYESNQTLIELRFEGLKNPVAFLVEDEMTNIVLEGERHQLRVGASDCAAVLQRAYPNRLLYYYP